MLRVTVQQIYIMARKGLIPSVRVGMRVRFDEEALQEWAEKGGEKERASDIKIVRCPQNG